MKTPISPKISLKRLRHVAAQQFDIRIASDGRWFHEGDEIRRFELVKLFASILVLDDDGEYWLATPAEKGRITVDDAPFIIRDMTVKAGVRSKQNEICFQTNIDETVLLDKQHPLQLRAAGFSRNEDDSQSMRRSQSDSSKKACPGSFQYCERRRRLHRIPREVGEHFRPGVPARFASLIV